MSLLLLRVEIALFCAVFALLLLLLLTTLEVLSGKVGLNLLNDLLVACFAVPTDLLNGSKDN